MGIRRAPKDAPVGLDEVFFLQRHKNPITDDDVVLDHIIIGDGIFVSLKEENFI